MGRVYLAHNRLLGRDEVLKLIGREVAEIDGARDRFLREIRAVAGLRHPNIVTAYSAFRAAGTSSWPWNMSTAWTWSGWSRLRARCRSTAPAVSSTRRPWACSTRTSGAWSTATSSRAT